MLTKLTKIPLGPATLFVSKDLIILLISVAFGFGRSRLWGWVKFDFFSPFCTVSQSCVKKVDYD